LCQLKTINENLNRGYSITCPEQTQLTDFLESYIDLEIHEANAQHGKIIFKGMISFTYQKPEVILVDYKTLRLNFEEDITCLKEDNINLEGFVRSADYVIISDEFSLDITFEKKPEVSVINMNLKGFRVTYNTNQKTDSKHLLQKSKMLRNLAAVATCFSSATVESSLTNLLYPRQPWVLFTPAGTTYNDAAATTCYSDLILSDLIGNYIKMVYNASAPATYNYDTVSLFYGTFNTQYVTLSNGMIYLDPGAQSLAPSITFEHELIQGASPFTVYAGVNFNFSLPKGGTFNCGILGLLVGTNVTTLSTSGSNCVATVTAGAVGSYVYRIRYLQTLYEYDLVNGAATQLNVIALPTVTNMSPAIAVGTSTNYVFLFSSTYITNIVQCVLTPTTVGYSAITVTSGNITNTQGSNTCSCNNVNASVGGNYNVVLTDNNGQTFTYSPAGTYWTISSYTPTTYDGTGVSSFTIAITTSQAIASSQISAVKLKHTDTVTIVTATSNSFAGTVITSTFSTGIKPGNYDLHITDINNNDYTIVTQFYYDWVIANYTPLYYAANNQINLTLTFTHALSAGTITAINLLNAALTVVDALTVGVPGTNTITAQSAAAGDVAGTYYVSVIDNNAQTTKHPTKIIIYDIDSATFAGTALATTATTSNYSFVIPFTSAITIGTITKVIITNASTAAALSSTNISVSGVNLTVTFPGTIPGGLYNLSLTDLNASTLTSTNQLKVTQIINTVTQIEYPANVNISLDIGYANAVTSTDIASITLINTTPTSFLMPAASYVFAGSKLTATLAGGVASGTYTIVSKDSNNITYNYPTSMKVYAITAVAPASLPAMTAITGTTLTVTLDNATLTTPFTAKLVSVASGAKTTMTVATAGASVYLTHATGLPTDYYKVELTNQWGVALTSTQQIYFGFGISSVVTTVTQVTSAISFTLTFSGTLSTNPSTTISKVTITDQFATATIVTMGNPGTTTLACTYAAGLNIAGWYTITAYDSNTPANTMTIATQISIYMKIALTSVTQMTANTAISFNVTFNQALNTGDPHTVISTMVLKDTVNNVSYPLTMAAAAGSVIAVSRAAINIPSNYVVIATDSIGNVMTSAGIQMVMNFVSYTPTYFEEGKAVTFTVTMSHTLNATAYQTISQVMLYDVKTPAVPISTTIMSTNLSTCIVTLPGGLTLSSYTVAVYDSATTPNRINAVTQLQITMSIIQTVNDKFIVGDVWQSIATFSSNLNAASPFTSITSVSLYSTLYGTLALSILGTGTPNLNDITYKSFGVASADTYSLKAIDGNGNTITSPFYIQIKVYIISYTPMLYNCQNMLYFDVKFNENLNTGARNIVTIQRVELVSNTNTVVMAYKKMTALDTMNVYNIIPNYGDYGVNAYDMYGNLIIDKLGNHVRITISLISFNKEINDQYQPLYLTLTFSHDIDASNNFSRIEMIKLRNAKTKAEIQVVMKSTNKNVMNIEYLEGVTTIGAYTIVGIDGYLNEIIMPTNIYIIPKGTCLENNQTVNYVAPKASTIYSFNGRCAKVCPPGYLPDGNSFCTNVAADQVKIIDSSTIVTNCPSGNVLENKNCVPCLNKGLYYYNSQCTTACPSELGFIESGECVNCVLTSMYLDNGKCVAGCSELKVNLNGVCTSCAKDKVFYKDACIDFCPTGTYKTDKGSCEPKDDTIPPVYKERCQANTCHHGTCNEYVQSVDCDCPDKWLGQYCQFGANNIAANMVYYGSIISDMLSKTTNNEHVLIESIIQLLNMQRLFEQVPELFQLYPTVLDNVNQIATSQLNLMNQDRIVVDPNVFLLADIAIDMNIFKYKSNNDNSDDFIKKYQKEISDIKDRIELVANVITTRLDSYISSSQPTLLLGGKRVQIQIGYNNDDFAYYSKNYKLSAITNLSDVERVIGNKIKVKKIDYTPETFLTNIQRMRLLQQVTSTDNTNSNTSTNTNSNTNINPDTANNQLSNTNTNSTDVNSNSTSTDDQSALYNIPLTGSTKINLPSLTSRDVKYQVYLSTGTSPLNTDNLLHDGGYKLNMTIPIYGLSQETMNKYQTYYGSGIEIYDPNSKAFTDRCFNFIDPITGFDTTLNYRIQNYFNGMAASCGSQCSYNYISTDFTIVCSCQITSDEAYGTFSSASIKSVSDVNLDMVKCANSTASGIGTNKALYIIIAIIFIAVVLTVGLFFYDHHMVKKHLKHLIKSDGHFYNRTMRPASYFTIVEDEEKLKAVRPTDNNPPANANAEAPNLDNINFHRSEENNDNGSIGEGRNERSEQGSVNNNANIERPPLVGLPPRNQTKQDDDNELILKENMAADNGNGNGNGIMIPGMTNPLKSEKRELIMNQINNNLFLLISKLGEKDINFKGKKAKPQTARARSELQHPYDNENITIIDGNNNNKNNTFIENDGVNNSNEIKMNPYMNKHQDLQIGKEDYEVESENSSSDNYKAIIHKTKIVDDHILHFDDMDIKPNKNLFINDKDRVIPVTDYEILSTEDSVKYDRRSFIKYVFDFLYTYHIIFSLFRRSLLYPYHIRAWLVVFAISAEFAMNAFLYSDSYITFKASLPASVRVNIYLILE
jgi:hypothetical protein